MAVELKQALEELRKQKVRKFNQTVDLIVNLKGVDLKRTNISLIAEISHKFKEKKVCGFLTKKSDLLRTISKPDFAKYKDAKEIKKLVDEYDFFIAHGSLMPAVATAFGKVLGPAGKMPSPQLGIIMQESEGDIKDMLDRIGKSVKIRVKEASIKVAVGKIDMNDDEIADNINKVYKAVEDALPTKRENIKKVLIKFTMTKPIEVKI